MFPYCLQVACLLATIFLVLLGNTNGLEENSRMSGLGRLRSRRDISHYHDTMLFQRLPKAKADSSGEKSSHKKKGGRYLRQLQLERFRRAHPYAKNTLLLPADESLRRDFYSPEVENRLGSVELIRGRRDNAKSKSKNKSKSTKSKDLSSNPIDLANTANEPSPDVPSVEVLAPRIHDIEEIFTILARRDGQFLEQMLSIKSAIDRLYSIFEYLGVANMPPEQREKTIRDVIRNAFNIDSQKQLNQRKQGFYKRKRKLKLRRV